MENYKNKGTEEFINTEFRPMEKADAPNIIECLREEYEETYFRPDFYDPEAIWNYHKKWEVFFIVAETDTGEIAGFMGLKSFLPEDGYVEMICQVFKKKYRGFSFTFPMLQYALQKAHERSFTAIHALAASYHTITQNTLTRLGLITCGFVHGVLDMSREKCSFDTGKLRQHAQIAMVLPQSKNDAGTLYVSEDLQKLTDSVYRSLSVNYKLGKGGVYRSESIIKSVNSQLYNNNVLIVDRAGYDLEDLLLSAFSKAKMNEFAVINLYLNVNDPSAAYACKELYRLGFFCSGFKALSGKYEYMIFHNPLSVTMDFSQYRLNKPAEALLKEIEELRECLI